MYKINNNLTISKKGLKYKYLGQDKDVPFMRWENQLKIYMSRNFLGVQWLVLRASLLWACVQSLVMLRGSAKPKQKQSKQIYISEKKI